ncbi:MAG: hypothetical protein JSW04_15680 [Desulfobacterales bacterium]|nr:MAG: hypothetical protein JSW04_15680 [Desulfobacterales bacterium]
MLEIGRIIDPSSRKEAFFREIFTALPDSYALVSNDHLIGIIANESLSEKIQQEPKNIFGKLLTKVIPQVGLTMRLEPDQLAKVDARILLAGMTLLQVHDITGVNRY